MDAPSEPCVVCAGCERLIPLRETARVGRRRLLRCGHCDLVREWLVATDGSMHDLGAHRDAHAEELARLRSGSPLVVADILAAR